MSKTILTICFSLVFLMGCKTFNPVSEAWVLPNKLNLNQPKFEQEGDRLYLDKENAVLLRNNIAEMKAREKKLEILIRKISDNYGLKFKYEYELGFEK
jgi:hypothetical protein